MKYILPLLLLTFVHHNSFANPATIHNGSIAKLHAKQSTPRNLELEKKLAKQGIDSRVVRKAQELEGIMIATMIEPMFPDGENSLLFGGGHGSDVYRSLFVGEYGQIMAQSGGLGLTESIVKNLIRNNSQRNNNVLQKNKR